MPESDLSRQIVTLLLVVLFFTWVVWYGRRRARSTARKESSLSQTDLDTRSKLQRAMEQLQVNIMEFGRDVEARLDTKIATLGRLIQDADERIKTLQDLQRSPQARTSGELPPLHREVYRLSDEGLDKVEIARRTSITPGEVELILGLRKQRND